MLFNVLAMVAEFESDLIRLRTCEGMNVARAKGRRAASSPSSTASKKPTWSRWCTAGEYSTAEVAELFGVGRSTVYRAIERQPIAAKVGIAEASSRR